MSIQLPVRMDSALDAPVHPADVIRSITHRDIAGTKVLFINMPLRETSSPTATPEGPLLLATNLIQNYGVEATIIDLNAYRIQDDLATARGLKCGRHLSYDEARGLILRHIQRHGEPALVGLSGKITTLRWQERTIAILRELLPDTFIVSGGGLATELKAGLFNYIPALDGIAHSEGDDVVVKIVHDARIIKDRGLVHALLSGALAPYNIGFINGRQRFVYGGDRPRNLNVLPYADLELLREDVDGFPILERYLQTPAWSTTAGTSSAIPWKDEDVVPKTTSVSSRGCPYHCFYCFRKTQGEQKWGVRSAEHIMNELLDRIQRYKIKFHAFPDDNFAVTLDRIRDLNALVAWGTHTRLDEVAGLNKSTEGTAETMAKAGCKYIGFGPESASAPVLEAIGKGGHTLSNGFTTVMVNGRQHEFPRSMVVGIENAARVGIHGNCTWIVGSPTETLEDVKESVLFMQWQMEFYQQFGAPPESVNTRMFTMTWYPGVSLINHPRVRSELTRIFGLQFQELPNKIMFRDHWEPVMDNNFYRYLIELDDATKVLEADGEPLNFSNIPNDQFLQIRELIDNHRTLDILNL
ncbi:MAG: radical SAM protein [Candidatus Yanofskybacteria bacterium]|nr:radical SAM protein [Candidatus Yanofskybacteria bacterium]